MEKSIFTESNNKVRLVLTYISLIALAILLIYLNLCMGSSKISLFDIKDSTQWVIIHDIRLPRLIATAILGGALALSGYLLQTFFSNPLAGPYVLGISSGAKLFVAILMVVSLQNGFLYSSNLCIAAAFLGSMLSMLFVIIVSYKTKNMAILIVCGVMIGYICSAITEFFITFAADQNIVNLHSWSVGSFGGISWANIRIIIPVITICLSAALLMSKGIAMYEYGEEYAKSAGMNIIVFRIAIVTLSSLLSATVTAFAGPVSFVGIAIPRLIKLLFKSSKPVIMITGSFLGGMIACLFADLFARMAFAPTELSISTVTAIFLAPVVIAMLISRRSRNA